MKQFIVTTSINSPTKAIKLFDAMPDWHLVVAGDKKTPEGYMLWRGTYLSPEKQEELYPKLSEAIPWNCIQRRNLAILWAYDQGADIIAVVDDDNIPYEWWGKDLLFGGKWVNYYETKDAVFDPVGLFNRDMWHRGFPLPLLSFRESYAEYRKEVFADVQADFWNGAPDIDAICRFRSNFMGTFDPKKFPVASSSPSPFNSQNTFLLRKVIPHYFLFPFIGRMDDIWASYLVQAKGFRVIYGKPSVYQERNPHDIIQDMKQEYIGYENNLKLVEDLMIDPERIFNYLPEKSAKAFDIWRKHFA